MDCSKNREEPELKNFFTHAIESPRSRRYTKDVEQGVIQRELAIVHRKILLAPEPPCTAARIGEAQVLNVFIRKTQVWISHFNHEGPIRSSAFDMLDSEDFPYSLALIFTLRRYKQQEWAITLQIDAHGLPPRSRSLGTFRRNWKNRMELHCDLSGCSSWISYESFGRHETTLKLSHVESSRTSEVAIVERAREFLDILPCLPPVLGSAVGFDDLNTCYNQQGFGIEMDKKKIPRRMLRAIVWGYFPLIALTTDMVLFRAAFVRLICFHAILWLCGIEHGDISVANLMCSKDGTPTLCDYDLSYLAWEETPTGFASTGTTKFMASELLTNRAMVGGLQKVYRHDAEAFAWVLLWILGRYRDGKQLDIGEGRLFDTWARQINYAEVKEERVVAFASAVKLEVQIPQPLSDCFRVDAFQFIGNLRNSQLGHEMAIVELATQGAFLDQQSKQDLERKIAEFGSVTFIRKVLDTRLVASSEYSGLVKDALGSYMAKHDNSHTGIGRLVIHCL